MDYVEKILNEAERWQGLKEIPQNKGWENKEFLNLALLYGWTEGDPWCGIFVKIVFLNVFKGTHFEPAIMLTLTKSSYLTWKKGLKSNYFTFDNNPQPGDIAIWHNYKDGVYQFTGHEAIVYDVFGDAFTTIGGNESNMVKFSKNLPNFGAANGKVLKGFLRLKYDLIN